MKVRRSQKVTTACLGGAVLLSLLLTAGCMGPVAQKPVANPTPTAVPGGGSQAEYEARMRATQQQQGR